MSGLLVPQTHVSLFSESDFKVSTCLQLCKPVQSLVSSALGVIPCPRINLLAAN